MKSAARSNEAASQARAEEAAGRWREAVLWWRRAAESWPHDDGRAEAYRRCAETARSRAKKEAKPC